MRNKLIIIVLGLVIVLAAAWAIANRKTTPTTQSAGSSSSSGSSAQSTQPAATNKVTIANMAFSPADITVQKGTTVTWTNQDSVAHTVTENDGKNGPSAAPLSQGQGYSFTFNEVGTFHYHCSIHQGMTGTVTVTQ